jgi:hypothetical protein
MKTACFLFLPYRSLDRTPACFAKVVKNLYPRHISLLDRVSKSQLVTSQLQIINELYIFLFIHRGAGGRPLRRAIYTLTCGGVNVPNLTFP